MASKFVRKGMRKIKKARAKAGLSPIKSRRAYKKSNKQMDSGPLALNVNKKANKIKSTASAKVSAVRKAAGKGKATRKTFKKIRKIKRAAVKATKKATVRKKVSGGSKYRPKTKTKERRIAVKNVRRVIRKQVKRTRKNRRIARKKK